ncbi:MAG: hypothetical protein Kow0069_36790 [Promethearchaeota archaeon]
MTADNFFDEELSQSERILYDRQFRLDGWDQRVLKEATVLVAGVGGLGCEIAKNLTMVGVGTLHLVDLDVIEHTNLNRQFLFVGAPMGAPKATVAARRLEEINPNVTVVGHHGSLERLDPFLYREADVIVGGLDSVNARLNLNAQAVRFGKPLVDGGVSGYHGHVYTTFPGENACYECYPVSEPEVDDMAACTVVGVPRKRTHCALKAVMAFVERHGRDPNPRSRSDVEEVVAEANELVRTHDFPPPFTLKEVMSLIDRHDPGLITVNAVVASLQSHETIKLLFWLAGNENLGSPNRSYIIYNGMTCKFYSFEKPRNPDCTQCGDHVSRADVQLSSAAPASSILEKLEAAGHALDPDLVPVITVNDFDQVREVDPDRTVAENGLRHLELLNVAGFKEGEVLVTLLLDGKK